MLKSVEERVEDYYKNKLAEYGVRIYGKAEDVNEAITKALQEANSKQGGDGANYPDIKILLEDDYRRTIPVTIEAKGLPEKLEKLDKAGRIVGVTTRKKDGRMGEDGEPIYRKGDPDYSAIANYAVNGALHYGKAILDYSDYDEVIIVGLNGTRLDDNGFIENPEHKAYYVSKSNGCVPKHIKQLDDSLILFSPSNLPRLYKILDSISLSNEEIERIESEKRADLENKIKSVLRYLCDEPVCKKSLNTNERLYLLIGLIIAGVKTSGLTPLATDSLCGSDSVDDNDGLLVLRRVRAYLSNNGCSEANITVAMRLLEPVFTKKALWKPVNDESVIKRCYRKVFDDISPLFVDGLSLRADNPLFEELTSWVSADDVVSIPGYVSDFMARIAGIDKDSHVWIPEMGAGGFLVSALDLMIADATEKLADQAELDAKIEAIKAGQITGSEVRNSSFGFALLKMILMGNCAASITNSEQTEQPPADILLLNPPSDTTSRGLSVVYKELKRMSSGYACAIVRENASNSLTSDYAKDILKSNTLIASIRMPKNLLSAEVDTQTAIYLFQAGRPHEEDDLVSFIDFSNDGYSRQNKRKSDKSVNLKDVDNAKARYDELVARLTGKEPKTSYYTEESGLFVKDVIALDGADWTYSQHIPIDYDATYEEVLAQAAAFCGWRINSKMKEGVFND